MEKKTENDNLLNKRVKNNEINNPIGYPLYPNKEDIYNQWKEETEIDPEDISKMKISNDEEEEIQKELTDNTFEGILDIPGSELDNEQEDIGSEDEENNYYSIGGDNHNNLEENNRY